MKASRTPLFLDGAKARKFQFPLSCVWEQKTCQKLYRSPRILSQDAPQFLSLLQFTTIQSGDSVFCWTVRDIFVVRRAGLFAPQKQFTVFAGKFDRRAFEEYDVASLEVLTHLPGTRLRPLPRNNRPLN